MSIGFQALDTLSFMQGIPVILTMRWCVTYRRGRGGNLTRGETWQEEKSWSIAVLGMLGNATVAVK